MKKAVRWCVILQNVLNGYSNFNGVNRAFDLPDPALVASKRIIVMTCGAAGILRCGDYLTYHKSATHGRGPQENVLLGIEFSHVLIDEAGQVTPSLPSSISNLPAMAHTVSSSSPAIHFSFLHGVLGVVVDW